MATEKVTKRERPDWDAIERDYRTGKFTLRELEAKFGVNNAQIARKIKAKGWTKDLGEVVRQATHAKLIEEIVSKEVSSGQQAVSNTVLAVAEINSRVLAKHQERVADIAGDLVQAQEKLITIAAGVTDIREAAAFVSAIESIARTTKILVEIERKTLRLDNEPQTPAADALTSLLSNLGKRSSMPIAREVPRDDA